MRIDRRLLTIAILGTLLFGTGVKLGISYFNDVATSRNELSAGSFDIALSKNGKSFYNDLKLFSLENLKPGDVKTVNFSIKNRGKITISHIKLTFQIKDEEAGMTDAEKRVDKTPDTGELSRYIIVQEMVVSIGTSSWHVRNAEGKSLKELEGLEIELLKDKLEPGKTMHIKMTLRFSEDAGNECQTDKTLVNMTFTATQ